MVVIKKAVLIELMCGLVVQADARSVGSNVLCGVLSGGAAWLACSHLYTQAHAEKTQWMKIEHQAQLKKLQQQIEAFSKKVVALEQEKEQLTIELAQASVSEQELVQKTKRIEDLERELAVLRQHSEKEIVAEIVE